MNSQKEQKLLLNKMKMEYPSLNWSIKERNWIGVYAFDGSYEFSVEKASGNSNSWLVHLQGGEQDSGWMGTVKESSPSFKTELLNMMKIKKKHAHKSYTKSLNDWISWLKKHS